MNVAFLNRLRCDRAEPCGTCVRRGLATSCAYVRSSTQGSLPNPPTVVDTITDRIGHLEQLVTSLVENSKNPNASASERVAPLGSMLPPSPGQSASGDMFHTRNSSEYIRVDNNETTYAPRTHWTVILDQVIGFCKSTVFIFFQLYLNTDT